MKIKNTFFLTSISMSLRNLLTHAIYIYIHIYCVRLMNKLNSLKHVQHFDAHKFNQRTEKEKMNKFSV